MSKQFIILVALTTVFCSAFAAQNTGDEQPSLQQSHHLQRNHHKELTTCPPVNALQVNKMIWSAQNGWVSYYRSFITKVGQFTGAHWVGVGVGKVLCSYTGASEMDFGLTLENANFVQQPSGHLWRNEVNGVINCLSNKVTDCPFFMLKKDNSVTTEQDLLNLRRAH